mgnify:FL=1
MNVSYKWLRQYTPVDVDEKTFVHEMCMTGTEVTGYEKSSDIIKNCVVGKILDIQKHENADKLVVCQVDIGRDEPIQIVTAATNVFVGAVVPVALDGSTLFGGINIKKGKLRGVLSDGMFCSVAELGLTVADYDGAIEDGILILKDDTPIGEDICAALGLDDTVFIADIATNRPDCLSIRGIAREAAVTFDKPYIVETPSVKGEGVDVNDYLTVTVEDPELCPRYSARVVTDIKIAPSPKWMVERLRSCGIRSINNIVDITNYVMLEYGQPMHAFDYSCLKGGKINVRRAKEGEKTVTLDGQERTLASDMLVIADAERAVAVAGIMGGENSEIKDTTEMIVFESANFDGPTVRKGAKGLGMRTDASALFEKRLDPQMTVEALDRACELVEMLGAGKVSKNYIDVDNSDKTLKKIELDVDWINHYVDIDMSDAEMKRVFTALGMTVDGNTVTVPSFRSDIESKYDLSEEAARIYGYDKIPAKDFRAEIRTGGLTERQKFDKKTGILMRACGYTEIMTFSFVSPKSLDKICLPADHALRKCLKIMNPLGEDTSVMRTTGLPSLLEVASRNYSFRAERAALYELATVYIPAESETELPEEKKILTAGIYGEGVDFFTVKGAVQQVLSQLHINKVKFKPCTDAPSYHPGRTACVYSGDTYLGIVGQLHPTVAKNYGINTEVYAFEFDMNSLYDCRGGVSEYKPVPKYPAVTRDLSLVCKNEVYSGDIEEKIKKAGRPLLESIKVFDVYTGLQVAHGYKSIAYALVLRSPDHTLGDEEIDAAMKKIISVLEADGIYLRA